MTTGAPSDDRGDERLVVSSPTSVAAGLGGVVAGARAARDQMGLRRTARTLLRVNQDGGFDCPGCAWPEAPGHGHLEFCENGVKAVAEEATSRRVTRAFFAAHTVDMLAERSDHWLGQQGRLTEPMLRRRGRDRYEAVSWDDALGLLADELAALDSPEEAVFYTSGRTSNEAAFLYQLLVRRYGTNNLPDCSNMCHESSGVALTETIGVGKGSVTLEDLEASDLIFVVGQNPGTNHPRMLTTLERATRAGARIVAVNPLPEAGLLRFKNPQRPRGLVGRGTEVADLFLQVRVNGDLALFTALGRRLLDDGAVDHEFLDAHVEGFEEWAAHVRALDLDELVAAAGIDRADLDVAHRLVRSSRSVVVCWAMGLTQHRNSVATIREIVNFLLLRGNIGRRGAGVCPVRGHSNVQGDRTMGIVERPPAWIDRLGEVFGFRPPTAHGLDTVDAIRAMRDGRARVFVGMGGNFAAAAPDTEATYQALRRCRLTAHVSTKLNRSHTVTGEQALILPTLGRTDRSQPVSVEDSMGVVHLSTGTLDPPHPQLLSEVAIVCRLARRLLGPADAVDWEGFEGDHDRIRDAIAEVVPGFEAFNDRVRRPGGFVLPHPPRDSRTFPTPTGRARMTVNPVDALAVPPGHLLLQTVRSHDQYNTTIYGLDDRYRGIAHGRRVVFVHADDLAAAGVSDGDLVDVVSVHDGVERRASSFRAVAYPTARGCCAAYFPEANVLVPLDSTAEGSNTPTSKSVVVRLERPT